MAVTASRVDSVPDIVVGNKRMHMRKLVFSSNYAAGGEAITAADFDLHTLEHVLINGGVAMASALTTGCPVGYNAATGKIVFYEGESTDATPLPEKGAEAHITGAFVYATGIGQ